MKELTTEDKILEAAGLIFLEKGYAAARMRDIAAKANVNLALLNYYYKTKENLFAIIMRSKVQQLFGTIIPCLSDEKTSLEEKIDLVVEKLYKVISADQNLPIFVFGEIQKQGKNLLDIFPSKELKESYYITQLSERKQNINPLQYVLNMMSLIMCPYVMMPMMVKAGVAGEQEVAKILKERVKLIPQWMKLMLSNNE